MVKYKARKSAPTKLNKHFYKDNVFYQSGYGMPNCTCYAWGRWYELMGVKPKLSTRNAENWFGNNDGYKRGQEPKLGAIICWSKGKVGVGSDGAGHVAVVEQINSDGSIVTSNSAWKSTNFYLKTIKKGYKVNGYTFQGFIYPPIEFVSDNFRVGKTYKLITMVKVREGAGIDARWKDKKQLTLDGQKNAVNQTKAVLKTGTKVTILELKQINADVWARIPSGWIALKYNGKTFVR